MKGAYVIFVYVIVFFYNKLYRLLLLISSSGVHIPGWEGVFIPPHHFFFHWYILKMKIIDIINSCAYFNLDKNLIFI